AAAFARRRAHSVLAPDRALFSRRVALAGARQGAQGRGELRGRAKAARRRRRAASGTPVG
ncbi:hypothetical protein AB0D33_30975, partial [Streptomyces sp. NPDC048404]|uniref:hypothetical protein n=1 Tax=Streptomyces sp. NPDC048404 TaxID=3154721 RepID=UPI003449A5CC